MHDHMQGMLDSVVKDATGIYAANDLLHFIHLDLPRPPRENVQSTLFIYTTYLCVRLARSPNGYAGVLSYLITSPQSGQLF
jgi:hypothetical protein